jgi:hypothetical protein
MELEKTMSYPKILRQRIAAGELTYQEAFDWLLSHGMNRHALEMICVKLVRLCQDPTPANIDNVVDIAGYARTIAMVWDKEYE